MIVNKHYRKEYMPFEEESLMILEQYGIGFYNYKREIEIITQTLKAIFNSNNKESVFDINNVQNCNLPWAENVIFKTDCGLNNTFGEYVPEYKLDKDDKGMPQLPPPDKDVNYDYEKSRIREAYILIHFDQNADYFDEVKYRQVVAHELVHLRDDYELRRISKNELSLLRDFVSGNLTYDLVMTEMDRGNRNAHLIYRLFINTEWHALSSQIYMDFYGLYKDRGNHLERKNASDDIKETESFQIYELLRDDYKFFIMNLYFGNAVIKFFPKWDAKYRDCGSDRKKKDTVINSFKKWFTKIADTRLKTVFNRMIKVCGIFYNDIEDTDNYTFETYKKNYYDSMKMVNESLSKFNAEYRIYEDENIPVFTVSDNTVVPLMIKYNKLFEHV